MSGVELVGAALSVVSGLSTVMQLIARKRRRRRVPELPSWPAAALMLPADGHLVIALRRGEMMIEVGGIDVECRERHDDGR